MSLHNLKSHAQLSKVFVFSETQIQLMHRQAMHYLHGYFAVYTPRPSLTTCAVRRGLLLSAILGMTLKVQVQDYVLEYLPIREQLALFNVQTPTGSSLPKPASQ